MPEDQAPDPVQHDDGAGDDAGELEDGDLVAGLRHARQARRAALERGGEGGEGFVLWCSFVSVFSPPSCVVHRWARDGERRCRGGGGDCGEIGTGTRTVLSSTRWSRALS